MIPFFRSLGERIERVWIGHSYEEEVFAEIAREALEQEPPHRHVGIADIVDWTFGSSHACQQPNERELFGEPPVMLFQGPRFYIEALFWLSGTTAIHEHAFSGAFTVLAGSSFHSNWHFTLERTINPRLLCGRLERVSTEILRPGSIRSIRPGNRLIHQLFHLDLPSVTIVVRTNREPRHLPQYQYLPPGLAIDHEDREGLRTRRLMFLNGMARGHLGGLRECAHKLIENADLETLYHMFSALTRHRAERALLDELYGLAHRRHGHVVDLFREVCEGERRSHVVSTRRDKVSDPQARFLLALLMLMPDRDAIFEAIRLQHPDAEPLAAIETWLECMSGKETIGFEFSGANRLIFRGLVEGLGPEALLQRLQEEFRKDSVDVQRDRLIDHAKRLARSDLFFPLFSKSQLREEARMA